MTRFFVGVLFVAVALVTGLAAQALLLDPEHAKPDRSGRPDAGVPIGSLPASVFGADPEGTQQAVAVLGWVTGVQEAEWREGERREQERLADLARSSATSSDAGGRITGVAPAYGCNIILPDSIVQRESGGNCNAYNPTGCGGRGCLGYAQVDQGHFAAVSPWNGNVAGTCYGLSYDECVERLWNGGAGVGHWR